ncbi:MAG: hypothetical protein EA350_11995 [Gemmatimonadales bacterium]|nr:MAG: hypothetical protein EA350_11995 [Gemmatimonadales bacterium]
MTPVDPRLRAPLGVVSRRLVLLAAMNGGLAGLLVAVLGLVAWMLAHPLLPHGSGPGVSRAAGWLGVGAVAGMALSLHARFRARRRHGGWLRDAARQVESRIPESRNLVLTAAEFSGAPRPPDAKVRESILADAAALLNDGSSRVLVPLHTTGISLVGTVSLAVGLLLAVSAMGDRRGDPSGFPAPGGGPLSTAESGAQAGLDVVLRVVPPAYSGDSVQVHRNPQRVDALKGSRLELQVRLPARPGGRARGADGGETVVLETLDGRRELRYEGSGEFVGEMMLEVDGFLALERQEAVRPAGADPAPSPRRLIGLGALADPPPTVRISAPGQDLYLPDGNRVLDLEIEATDDRALRTLELLFTRVSGFGELFDFREGTIPLEITRHEPGRWTARAQWNLGELDLDRGDIVVYRAVAHDRLPGGAPGESDTWTVEILGSEAAPSGGFAGEDEMTRYGLSQQMVILLTERVREQRAVLSAERLAEEAFRLAAAQRRVRAEFVFMLGGELEDGHDHADAPGTGDAGRAEDRHDHDHDHGHGHAAGAGGAAVAGAGFDGGDARTAQELHEEAHARVDADAAEGRLAQAGRIELSRAIQAMSQAVNHLNAVDLDAALAAEARALEYLQRAFSSSRYLLRALSEREELDPGRRLSGERGSAVSARRPQVADGPDRDLAELREILGQVIRLVPGGAGPPPSGPPSAPGGRADAAASPPVPEASRLGARLLAVDPASRTLQRLSASLSGPLPPGPDGAPGRELLDVITELSRYLRTRHPPHPGTPSIHGLRHMEGAWAEALQRAGAGSR